MGRKGCGAVGAQGSADNPVILGWAKELGLAKVYNRDETPWCGLFAAIVAKRAGKALPSQPLWARSWVNFGKDGNAKPQLGDVLVFRRGEVSGHVGLYIGEDYGAFHVLGGNQSNGVTITRIAKDRCIAVRRPVYKAAPATAKPVELAATGALSANEA